jgi:hypothetical protein
MGPPTVTPGKAEYVTEDTAAWPALLRVHVSVASEGATTGVVAVQLNDNAAGVKTTRLTAVDVALPEFGVAVSVPLTTAPEVETAPAVEAVTVTVPQVVLATQAPIGPLTVAPVMAE